MLNLNPSKSESFEKRSPHFSPLGGSKNHPEGVFYLPSIDYGWKFGYKLIVACWVQINWCTWVFLEDTPVFSPLGVSKNHPEGIFYLLSIDYGWKFGYKLIVACWVQINWCTWVFLEDTPVFSPLGVSKNHPKGIFYLPSIDYGWKFDYKKIVACWVQINWCT